MTRLIFLDEDRRGWDGWHVISGILGWTACDIKTRPAETRADVPYIWVRCDECRAVLGDARRASRVLSAAESVETVHVGRPVLITSLTRGLVASPLSLWESACIGQDGVLADETGRVSCLACLARRAP